MPVDPLLLRSRARFDGGARFDGVEGLEQMSVSAHMSSPSPGDHRSRVATFTFGDTLVTRIRSQYLVSDRPSAMVDDAYSEYLQLALVISGEIFTRQGGHERTVAAGDVGALLPRRPFHSRLDRPSEVVQLYLPIWMLRAHGYSPDPWGGRRWTATPTAVAMRQLLTTVTSRSEAVAEASRSAVGRAIAELAIGMLHEAGDSDRPTHDVREVHRLRVRSLIADGFSDPALDVSKLAALMNVSPRYLHSLFKGEEFGVAGWLRQTRLRSAAALLASDVARHSTIASVGTMCGFRGEDQFTRAFKRLYGMTPSDFRAASASADPGHLSPDVE